MDQQQDTMAGQDQDNKIKTADVQTHTQRKKSPPQKLPEEPPRIPQSHAVDVEKQTS